MFRQLRGACLSIVLLVGVAYAQTGQGTLTGSVTDTSGAVVANATVVVKNQNTGFVYNAVTTAEGIYRVPYLNVGTYEVNYEAPGFKKLTRRDIPIRSSETLGLDVTLDVGNVVESVQVSAGAQLLETETATTGHLVSGVELTTLPTPQMKIESMVWYVSGVTSQSGTGHTAGGRARAFQFNTDGVSGNVPGEGVVATARQLTTVEHDMQEVKILTTALPAEYGHSGGGIMNIAFKGGTNQFHGLAEERYVSKPMIHRAWEEPVVVSGVFAFHLMSGSISGPIKKNRTFFMSGWQRHHERSGNNQNADVPSPAQLNGDFSNPGSSVVADRIYDPDSLVQLPNGSYSRTQFANNSIPRSRFDPVAVKFLALNPFRAEGNRYNSQFFDSTGPRQNLAVDTNKNSYRSGLDEKIDHSFSDKHKIFGRYSNARHRSMSGTWQMQLANRDLDYIATPIPVDFRQVAVSDSYVLNPTTINEVRLGWNRRKSTRLPESLGQNWASKFGIPNASPDTMPIFQTATGGQFYFRFPEGETVDVHENFSIQDNLSLIRGRHTFKTGYELLRTRINSHLEARPSGTYLLGGTEFPFTPGTGNTFASFLLGSVVRADFTKSFATWLPRWWSNALYFQDDWKATNKLTLNLGVRWQMESPYQTKYGQQSQFDPTAIDTLTGRVGALVHPSSALGKRDANNFQPRLGLAYNFRKDWVFRGGFAVNTLDLWTNSLRENFDEYLATAVIQQPTGNPAIAFKLSQGPPPINFNVRPDGSVPFVGNVAGRPASYRDPNIRAPYVMNWNGGIQKQFGRDYLLEVNYQGSSGVGLLNRWDINAIPLNISTDPVLLNTIRNAAQNYKPYPQFGSVMLYSNFGHSSFHSGTIKAEKRMSSGFTFTSFYTWGKSIDEASDDGTASGITYYNRSLEKGRSNYDVAHRWVTYAIWDLPVGKGKRWMNSGGVVSKVIGNWQLSAIQSAETGIPLTFSQNGQLPGNVTNVYLPGATRPNMAPGKTYDDIKLDWDRKGPCRHIVACALPWADINAFAVPPSYTPGQAGRNIINSPGMFWHQFALMKVIPVTERIKGTLRADFTAPFKYPFFSAPNTAVNFRNPQTFGKITSQQGGFSGLGARTETMIIFKLEF